MQGHGTVHPKAMLAAVAALVAGSIQSRQTQQGQAREEAELAAAVQQRECQKD